MTMLHGIEKDKLLFVALCFVALALYPTRTVMAGLAVWFVITVVATVVVPRVERPSWTHHEDYAGPPPRPGPLQ